MLDSTVFFFVAFWGVVAPENIWDIILTGYLIKVFYMMLVSPLLFFNRVEEEEGAGYSVILFRHDLMRFFRRR